MKKQNLFFLAILCLSGCYFDSESESGQYNLVEFPTETINFLTDYRIVLTSATFVEGFIYKYNAFSDISVMNAPEGKQFLQIGIIISRYSTLNPSTDHELARGDFVIKDHLDWDSSDFFSTTQAFPDYQWIGKSINPGNSLSTVLNFVFDDNFTFNTCLMVLEIDFSVFSTGVDVPITMQN